MEITIYAKGGSPYCWLTKRLLRHKGYALKVAVGTPAVLELARADRAAE